MAKVEIVNGSGQTVRIVLDDDGLSHARKQVSLGELESVKVLDDAPKTAPRKTAPATK
jgi:hypothetical protein